MAEAPVEPVRLEPDDASLIARLRGGEEMAYEALVRRETARLLAVTRRILGNEDDARDAVQDAFLLAFRGLPHFEGQSRLSTWLHRIAVNAALMKLRTRRRRREDPIEPLLPAYQDDGHHVEQFSNWPAADKLLEHAETRAVVRRQIAQLPETHRTVLLLRDIEGLDTEEVAKLLETTPNAVKSRLHRARQALRTLLAPYFRRGQM